MHIHHSTRETRGLLLFLERSEKKKETKYKEGTNTYLNECNESIFFF